MKLLAIAIICALCATAAADSGQQHSAHAQALYKDGKYREAHAEFAAGFELDKLPAFVFDMAECSRLAGDLAIARDEYTRYLTLEATGKLADVAKQRLAALPPAPKATPTPAPATAPTAPIAAPIPTPATTAARVEAKRDPAVAATARVDEPTPLWKRKSVWIGVGLVLAAGTVATLVATHHGDMCTGTCLDWTKP